MRAKFKNVDSQKRHNAVSQNGALRFYELAVLEDLRVTHQHVFQRNPNVVEAQKAVVDASEADFVADVTDSDAFHGLVGLKVADLDDEGLQAVIFAERVKLRENHGVVASVAKTAWKNK